MLEIKHITASYHKDYPILSDINMHIADNEKLVLLGRNGAGKTTFARTIFGLTPMISGEIFFNGVDILSYSLEKIHAMGMGFFMQGAPVFPQLSVRENLMVSSGKAGRRDFEKRYAELKQLLPLLADSSVDTMPAGSLSGGERTQLCVAMSIFRQPQFLVLDEPFAGLSPGNASLVLDILAKYQETTRASVLLIAQDRQMAYEFSSDHFLIREGKIEQAVVNK